MGQERAKLQLSRSPTTPDRIQEKGTNISLLVFVAVKIVEYKCIR